MLQSARPARIVALSVEQSALASMPCPVIIPAKTEKRFLDRRKTDRKPYRRKQAWTSHDDDVAKVSKLKLSLSETGAAVAPEPSLLPPASAVPAAGVLCMSVPAGPKARFRLRLDSAWPSARELALLLLPSAWRLPLTLCEHALQTVLQRTAVRVCDRTRPSREMCTFHLLLALLPLLGFFLLKLSFGCLMGNSETTAEARHWPGQQVHLFRHVLLELSRQARLGPLPLAASLKPAARSDPQCSRRIRPAGASACLSCS